jgi:transposase-like protein
LCAKFKPEADPKQTFHKLCMEQNVSVRNFNKWKRKLREVELIPLSPPAGASEIHSLVDEVAPSKKRKTFYSKEAKEDIVRKIQAAKEADPKQTFCKLCTEQNINVSDFYRWKQKLREAEGQKRGRCGLNAYNIFKSYMKHRLTNRTPLGLEEYVRVYFADPRTYADKHMKSIYKDSDRTALNLNDVFQTWKRSQSDTWGGRETNVLKVNAFLNAKWGDLSDAEKQPYQDALAALLTRRHKRPGQQEDEVVPSKKGGTFYSNEAKEDIVRKIQAAKEADPKQTFRKLCKEQNISVRNFYRWKKKLRGVELPPLPPPSPSIIPELPPLPPPSPSIIPELPPLPPPSPSITHD